jgi:riboflavin synthase
MGIFRGFRENKREMIVEAPGFAGRIAPGGSVAVDGVCLTLVRKAGEAMVFNPAKETLERTNFSGRRVGDPLNLESPLTLADPLGGHFVSGHVDYTGKVKSLVSRPPGLRLAVALPAEFRPFVVSKGSIAVNGVSLTVAAVKPLSFEIELIPATLARTNLTRLRTGAAVHVECDMLGKYVYNFLHFRQRQDYER